MLNVQNFLALDEQKVFKYSSEYKDFVFDKWFKDNIIYVPELLNLISSYFNIMPFLYRSRESPCYHEIYLNQIGRYYNNWSFSFDLSANYISAHIDSDFLRIGLYTEPKNKNIEYLRFSIYRNSEIAAIKLCNDSLKTRLSHNCLQLNGDEKIICQLIFYYETKNERMKMKLKMKTINSSVTNTIFISGLQSHNHFCLTNFRYLDNFELKVI